MRKLFLCLALALICTASLFASQALVTWTWYENDPDVMFYRYQVDAQDDDGWTVLDRDVNELTLLLDVSLAHSFYLQQSYDGEIWSQSSVVESEVFSDLGNSNEEGTVTEEETFLSDVNQEEEDLPAMALESPSGQPEETAASEASKANESRPPFRSLDYGFGYLNTIPDSAGPKTAGIFGSYSMPLADAGIFKIGFKANLAVYASKELFTHLSDLSVVSYANLLAMGVLPIGNSDIYLALGPDAGFNLFSEYSYRLGLSMELGVRYHRSVRTAFGIAFADHQYLFPSDKVENRVDVRIFMSTVF